MRIRIVAGVIVAAVAAAGVAYYFSEVPGRLADDYAREAEPEHEKLARTVERALRSFNRRTFGVHRAPQRRLERADSSDEIRRWLRVVVRLQRRGLRRARRQIRRARLALRRVDRDALLEVPSAPLLGDRGDLAEAEQIAAREGRYLRLSRAFLRRYARLVEWTMRDTAFIERLVREVRLELEQLPEATTPEQYVADLERIVGNLELLTRRYRRQAPPRDVRRETRAIVRLLHAAAAELTAVAAAVRRRDIGRLEQAEDNFERIERRARKGTRGSLRRLVERSSYRREINRIGRVGRAIETAYEQL